MSFVLTLPAVAGDAQSQLMGYEAAEADALVRLVQEVKGVWVSAHDDISKAVTELSERGLHLEGFVRGAKVVDRTALGDGLYRVTLEITLEQFAQEVTAAADRRVVARPGSPLPAVLRATGYGAAPGSDGGGSALPTVSAYEQKVSRVLRNNAHCQPAQRALRCKGAAEADSLARLVREVKGTWVESNLVVKDFVTEASNVTLRTEGLVRGARPVDFDLVEGGICLATYRITFEEFRRNVQEAGGPDPAKSGTTHTITIDATGYGACPPAGGSSGR